MADKTVTITDNATGKQSEMPVRQGTHGPDLVDIRTLQSELGYFTYDPGYSSTGSCQSDITFIDGDQGILLYRGYPIEQLAEQSSFLEVSRLLIHGDLPNKAELEAFEALRPLDLTLTPVVHCDVGFDTETTCGWSVDAGVRVPLQKGEDGATLDTTARYGNDEGRHAFGATLRVIYPY